jgi:hypothetical protein
MCWVWRVHAVAVKRLQRQWGVGMETIVVLHGGRVVWVVASTLVPACVVVIEGVLVVFMVHVQLAHVGQ